MPILLQTQPPNCFNQKTFPFPLLKGFVMIATFLITSKVLAHEFWILPDDFQPKVGQTVSLSTEVGQQFVGDDVPNIEDFYTDYSVLSHSGRNPVEGNLATDPPAFIQIKETGTQIVGQRTLRSSVEMEADEFIDYLLKQGMDYVIPQIKQRRLDKQLAKELYSRCAKSIIQTSDHTDVDALSLLATPLGYTYEIIPLSNPQSLGLGDHFKIKLLYEGVIQINAKVLALSQSAPEQPKYYFSDESGIVDITLDQKGVWMFSSVHMIQIDRYEADWESFWANLTFQIN